MCSTFHCQNWLSAVSIGHWNYSWNTFMIIHFHFHLFILRGQCYICVQNKEENFPYRWPTWVRLTNGEKINFCLWAAAQLLNYVSYNNKLNTMLAYWRWSFMQSYFQARNDFLSPGDNKVEINRWINTDMKINAICQCFATFLIASLNINT